MNHLNVRVAWHDDRWNGTVCRNPSGNSFCIDLDRIRSERDDSAEDSVRGISFADLRVDQLPACKADSGGFMNRAEWIREFKHPYQDIAKARGTHGDLLPTRVKIPPYSTFAVPFNWMLRSTQDSLDQSLAEPLPSDEESPFNSAWVFSRHRQEALCELFFGRVTPKRSLVFFYTKSGHPLDEAISRLVVAVGTVDSVSKLIRYDASTGSQYPMWDRMFSHSIRPDGHQGFLIPYHDYLEPTGDPGEDERRRRLLQDIAVVPEPSQIMEFSYAGELGTPDVALSTLVRCLDSVRQIRAHGIAKGPWEKREDWLNEKIAETWSDRGAFPGTGATLEALGMRLGTALALELRAKGQVGPLDDPWPILDAILRGREKPPQSTYDGDIRAVAQIWAGLPQERRDLLGLLSRFSLSPSQALRWFNVEDRNKATRAAVTDRNILENPY
jgi:hypothetical protein